MDQALRNALEQPNVNWAYSGEDGYAFQTLCRSQLRLSANRIQVCVSFEDTRSALLLLLQYSGRRFHYAFGGSGTRRYFPLTDGCAPAACAGRLLELLRWSGMSREELGKVHAYLEFLLSLDRVRYPDRAPGLQVIEAYTGSAAVETALAALLERGTVDLTARDRLLERYAEVRGAGPMLENALALLDQTFSLHSPIQQRIASSRVGDCICVVIPAAFTDIQVLQLFRLLSWDIEAAVRIGKSVALSVFEGHRQYDDGLLHLLRWINGNAQLTFFSKDAFAAHPAPWQAEVRRYFQAWIFSRHSSMESCGAVSDLFGSMPVTHSTYGRDYDRRLGSNRLIDMLLHTNRVDHVACQAPVWEPRYRKEEIYSMPFGVCLAQAPAVQGWVQL